ncbi:hypothetical protein D3C87_1667760 [compost metagenome]
MSERADFIGDNGKAPPRITRPRSFNGSVQRQEIGLFGYRANHVQNLADALCLIRQTFHLF